MLQITILPGKPRVQEGTSSKTGRPYRIVEQAAFVLLSDGTGAAITIQPGRDQPPYTPGTYTLAPESFYPADGRLAFSARLVPAGQGSTGGGGAK